MRLFQKAKKLGVWDPAALDFETDRRDWQRMSESERDFILRTVSLFQAGEEAVTIDLLPLLKASAGEGRIEEEIYLTSFLWEEAKHVELFRRWLDEVAVCLVWQRPTTFQLDRGHLNAKNAGNALGETGSRNRGLRGLAAHEIA
jgi:hypothetical protein